MNDLQSYARGELDHTGHLTHVERLQQQRARERWIVFSWLAAFAVVLFVGGIVYFLATSPRPFGTSAIIKK